jgi:hypothetical protein
MKTTPNEPTKAEIHQLWKLAERKARRAAEQALTAGGTPEDAEIAAKRAARRVLPEDAALAKDAAKTATRRATQ